MLLLSAALLLLSANAYSPTIRMMQSTIARRSTTVSKSEVFVTETRSKVDTLKFQILQMGGALDRGQAYNPTSGEYYKERMDLAKSIVDELVSLAPPLPTTLEEIDGEWELILATVRYGIFRSSPFFLAIQDAYANVGAPEKAELFFKLHELQVLSWGVSKVGRVAQYINATEGMLYSEFDTSIFSLTVVPFLGWGKLLPTFGGCVVTASKVKLDGNVLDFEVEYTTAKPVEGLQGVGEWTWDIKVPVNAVWKLLPWNKGKAPTAKVTLLYADDDFRIVADGADELFVYTRPVSSRPY